MAAPSRRSRPKRCWRRITGRRTATATAACRFWWTPCSTRSRSCSGRRSIRSGRKWRHAPRCRAGPASRRRRNGSTATCRYRRRGRVVGIGAPRRRAPAAAPCPAGPRSPVSRIPGMAGQPRQGQHQQIIRLRRQHGLTIRRSASAGRRAFWASGGIVLATVRRIDSLERNRVRIW